MADPNPHSQPEGASERTEAIRALETRLRQPEDQGGFDGYEPDPLHTAAADAIKSLRDDADTNWTLYEAWRKRAEEAEVREAALEAEVARLTAALADAQKDTERLNFVERREADVVCWRGAEHGDLAAWECDGRPRSEKDDEDNDASGSFGKTARAAIDWAIKQRAARTPDPAREEQSDG